MSYDVTITLLNASTEVIYEDIEKIGRARTMAEYLTRKGVWTDDDVFIPPASILSVAVTEHSEE